MTADAALEFLRSHQPLPATKTIEPSILARFDEVLRFFESRPDERCLPLLLNALGEGEGHGVYQCVAHTLRAHREDAVIDALGAGLRSASPFVRLWSAEFAGDYRRVELFDPLAELLHNGNAEERKAAGAALCSIGTSEALAAINSASDRESDPAVRRQFDFLRSLPWHLRKNS